MPARIARYCATCSVLPNALLRMWRGTALEYRRRTRRLRHTSASFVPARTSTPARFGQRRCPSSCSKEYDDGSLPREEPVPIGECYCGAIRYQVSGTPFHESNCHCSICRRTTGAPFVTWFSVRRGEFRFVSGEPARFKSSERGTRSFCPRCGGQLTFENSDLPEEIDVITCSLDDPNVVPPRDNVWTSSRVRWIVPDGLPEFRENRS